MAESMTLTTPVSTPDQTSVVLQRVTVDATQQLVIVQWAYNNGEVGIATYPTPAPDGSSQPAGSVILHALNTGNFSTTSLVKTTIQRLQTDGYLPPGTVSGTPS